MSKRWISLALTLFLLLACVVPGLTVFAAETVAAGSGFTQDSSSNTNANAWWADVDIYNLVNSVTEGFLLTNYSSSLYCGIEIYDTYFVAASISGLSPYTTANYPLGSVLTGLNTTLRTSSIMYKNYDAAYAAWSKSSGTYFYLTADSYIYFDGLRAQGGRTCFKNVKKIDSSGAVSDVDNTYVLVNTQTTYTYGLYSTNPAPSYTPAQNPVITNDLPTDSITYTAGSSAVPLSVSASVSDGGTLSYQWRGWSDNGALNGDIVGIGSSYTPDTSVPGTYTYSCTITNTTGTGIDGVATSSTATIIVTAPASTDPDDSGGTGGSGTVGGDSDDDVPILTDIFNVLTQGLLDIQSWFTEQTEAIATWGQSIVDAIGGMGEGISEALTEAFVPSEDAIQEMSENSEALIADRFGAVYEGAQMIDQWAGQLTVQTARPTLTVPAVTVNLAGVPFSFGGWDVAVVPEGFEFLAETCALVIDLVATLAFLNAMRRRLEGVLEG